MNFLARVSLTQVNPVRPYYFQDLLLSRALLKLKNLSCILTRFKFYWKTKKSLKQKRKTCNDHKVLLRSPMGSVSYLYTSILHYVQSFYLYGSKYYLIMITMRRLEPSIYGKILIYLYKVTRANCL